VERKAHWPANGLAAVALFVALGGGAYAASKVTGADIVTGSITGNQIKNRSVGGRDIGTGAIGLTNLGRAGL
jgi:hypothetical protein